MRTIKLDEDWDLSFSKSGKLEWITPPERFEQDLKIIIKTNLGSNSFHEEMGVNWFQVFDYPSKNNFKDAIRNALSQYYKPIIINNIDIEEDKDERKYYVKLDIKIEDVREEFEFTLG